MSNAHDPPPEVAAPAEADASADDPLIGLVIAERYRLVRKLGAGGMGAVYSADHVTLRKRVAVKLLHKEFADDKELIARFEREAMASANLDHPNIVAATDFGKLADGTLFLVMEYVEGRSLRRLIDSDGRVAPARAMRILTQIGAALSRAHSLNIVHRDLKPENVVVCQRDDGSELVKVIDFGIARVRSSTFGAGATALTQLGSVFGTPLYMAPEQAMGQVVDARADQYALGVIAFELLAGRPPYQSSEMVEVLQMHVGAPIPRLTSLAPNVPPAVDAVFDRFLGKLPSERFDSVADALARLEAALADRSSEPVIASIASPRTAPHQAILRATLQQFAAIRARVPDVALAGIALAMVVAGLIAVATNGAHPPAIRADRASAAQSQTAGPTSEPIARGVLPGMRPIARSAAYAEGVTLWRLGRYRDGARSIAAALDDDPALADDPELRGLLAGSLGDGGARHALEDLLETTALGRSTGLLRAIAMFTLEAPRREGRRVLHLIRGRTMYLEPMDRARLELRDSNDCAGLERSLAALDALGPGLAQDESRAVRAGNCEMLRRSRLCRSCLGLDRTAADDEE